MLYSPLPKWLEGLTKCYLNKKSIIYQDLLNGIKFKFPGYKEAIYTFDIKGSVNNPILEPMSLQHEIIQLILKDAMSFLTIRRRVKLVCRLCRYLK